ncbi:MAG: flagellar export chaperone FliS [Armatimonadota bacterium]
MSQATPYERYVETQVNTLTPEGLILMAYDGAIRFARTAREKMQAGKLDEQSRNIVKVQKILLELIASLDPKPNPTLADHLDRLYRYMFDRLTHANIRDDIKALEEVISALAELRSAWAQAAVITRSSAVQTGDLAA